jgi:sulfate adenylyltransferase subunit 1 (EFTu-like GTPase family)
MANYSPVTAITVSHAAFGTLDLATALTYTSTASGTISGGDPLEVSGSGTVAKVASANSVKFLGIAAHDATNGNSIRLYVINPIFDGIADSAITAGDQLVASNTASKTVKTIAAANVDVTSSFVQATVNSAINNSVNQARSTIGLALTSASDGGTVRWMMTS